MPSVHQYCIDLVISCSCSTKCDCVSFTGDSDLVFSCVHRKTSIGKVRVRGGGNATRQCRSEPGLLEE
jgi:hypothetical protein